MTGGNTAQAPGAPETERSEGSPRALSESGSALAAFLAELDSVALGLRQRAAAGEGSAANGEARLLSLLGEHPSLTVPQLARLRGTSRQNIQILVNRLAAQGCVEFSGNPGHKRSALVRLTEPGRRRLLAVAEREQRLERELAARFSEAEWAPGLELLRRLREALSREDTGPKAQARHPAPVTSGPRRILAEPPTPRPETTPGLSEEPNDYGLPVNLL